MKKKKKSLTKIKTKVPALTADTTPSFLIQSAITKGADLEKLEKLLDLQIRWEANEAKKAYVIAMAAFQSDPPIIGKDSHVEFETSKGKVKYNHASLSNVVKQIEKALSRHGFFVSFPGKPDETGVRVTCKITHVMGHSEEKTLKSASDITGGKNAIQAIGSAESYLQRYTLLALTGLATEDMDDDGKSTEAEKPKTAKTEPTKTKSKPTKPTPPADKKKVDTTPVTEAQATLIIQNIIGSHLMNNFEKWRLAKKLLDGENLFTKTKASKIIEWWIDDDVDEHGEIFKKSERKVRIAIEKDGHLDTFLSELYDKHSAKYPDDLKLYSRYCGMKPEELPFDILNKEELLKTYLEWREILGLDKKEKEGE